MSRERVMALSFAVGSILFFIAPLGIYGHLVGSHLDSLTYFVGSVPFTLGALLQALIAWADRRQGRSGVWLWRCGWIQLLGTVFFNVMTYRAINFTPQSPRYDTVVWGPNAVGSACFLLSGAILYFASPRRGVRLAHQGTGWWEPEVNLLGCVFFGISAVAGFAEPGTRSLLGPQATNWTTSLGAICFLACGLATLVNGRTVKSPRLRRWVVDVEEEIVVALRAVF